MWHERFSEVLLDMGFFPSRAEQDIWMRDRGDHYEYIARYVDDLAVASREPKKIMDALTGIYSLKLKGTGPMSYHLGCDYYRDKERVLCGSPKKYIEKMIDGYERMFGTKPRQAYTSPLAHGDHPELDDSQEMDVDGIKQYQSLIRTLQWAVTLARFDIATAVMTMSKFRAAPRTGHMDRVKRICGYIAKMRHACLRFRTDMPDLSDVTTPEYDWAKTIYGDVAEGIPENLPKPLGKPVMTITYVDANLYHDFLTGKSVTGILHFLNKTTIDWFSKKQGSVASATYGSEFVAAKTAMEQIEDLHKTLRCLGVPLEGPAYMFGDNKAVVSSSTIPHYKLNKRHTALVYHKVRESIAAKILKFIFIPGTLNPADTLSKAWGYQQVWKTLQPILFWEGDTADLLDE